MKAAVLELYRQALDSAGGRLQETSATFCGVSELEWQARWFAGEFGCRWQTVEGVEIEIEEFGKWNRESGPDFVDVRLRVGSRRVCGDVELDFDARDWERHGHGTNPGFRNTVLHIFRDAPEQRFFTRTCDHREVMQVQLGGESVAAAQNRSAMSLLEVDALQAAVILQCAARYRLDRKARALQQQAETHGEDHAWFSALAVALGYKNNQIPFLLLAQRSGLPGASGMANEALLFGLAGFLESPPPAAADAAVRGYLRALWEKWWTLRAGSERLILPKTTWRLNGSRPANHPHRRVAALAVIAANWKATRSGLARADRQALAAVMGSLKHPFWEMRANLQAAPLSRPHALIGADRLRDILINIFYPLAVAKDEAMWLDFLAERAPAPSSGISGLARKFFGPVAVERSFLSRAVAQQGLLQLERDYRLAVVPEEFLAMLRRFSSGSTVAKFSC